MKLTLKAILKTLSPMHISTAGSYRFNHVTGYVEQETQANSSNLTPCTAIQRMNVIGENFPVPVIPANNIAGRLRRHAAEMVLNAVQAKGGKVSLPAYSSLMCGAVGGSPDSRDLTYAEYKKSSEHVYMGLFGGGPRMLPRRVRVLNALPLRDGVLSAMESQMHPSANQYAQNHQISMAWTCRRNDDLMEMINVPLQEGSIENYVDEIQKRQAVILEEKSKGRSGTSTFSFSALEFVLPGTYFNLGFELDVNNAAQVGLFLMALDSFVGKERIGGRSVNGFGAFSLKEVVLSDEYGNENTEVFLNGRLNQNNTMVNTYLDAWVQAAGNIDVASIEEMLTMPAEAPLSKKAKAAKEAAEKVA